MSARQRAMDSLTIDADSGVDVLSQEDIYGFEERFRTLQRVRRRG
jgi:hypothetical protein